MINHIAFLVSSVDQSADVFRRLGFAVGPREIWDGEGTAEIYVGPDDQIARVLLLEPVRAGAYDRAFKKRGPGLHHIAVDVLNLEAFVGGLSGSGWYLHPVSIHTMAKTRTVWLARPGTAMLIEVQERDEIRNIDPFVQRVELPMTAKEQAMIAALPLYHMISHTTDEACMHIAGRTINVRDILC